MKRTNEKNSRYNISVIPTPTPTGTVSKKPPRPINLVEFPMREAHSAPGGDRFGFNNNEVVDVMDQQRELLIQQKIGSRHQKRPRIETSTSGTELTPSLIIPTIPSMTSNGSSLSPLLQSDRWPYSNSTASNSNLNARGEKKRKRNGGGTSKTTANTASTSISTDPDLYHQGHVIVALTEFRSRSHVGLSSVDLSNPEIIISQLMDNTSYTNTLTMLHSLNPTTILLPDTAEGSVLFRLINSEHQLCQIRLIKRKFFNEETGIKLIERLGQKKSIASISFDSTKYLCLSACGCLLKYIETMEKLIWAPQSLRVTFKRLDGSMQLDMATIASLELLEPLRTGVNSNSLITNNTTSSLFKTINHTKTKGGAKLLRSTVLHPLKDLATINTRLDCVQELLANENLYFQIGHFLPRFNDIETVCSNIIQVNRSSNIVAIQQTILHLISLRSMLEVAPNLHGLCGKLNNDLFQIIAENSSSPCFQDIIGLIDQFIDSDIVIDRKNVEIGRINTVFALKQHISGELEISRKAYRDAVDSIHQIGDQLIETHGLIGAKISYTTTRGYHLVMPARALDPADHQDILIQRLYRSNKVYCTTPQILSLNQRQEQAFADACHHTFAVLTQLLVSIRQYITWLNKLGESIAILDVIHSFSTHISLNSGYVRPSFSPDGCTVIHQGKHPVFASDDSHIPNDMSISPLNQLHIVTGPNNSGKSTYLRQMAVIIILAHMGCYVPATFAHIRIVEHLTTCMATNVLLTTTDIHEGASTSTFYNEMRQISRILTSVRPGSFVLIDEVGRSTGSVDGMSIAWSICERLMQIGCYGLFATHYLELMDLPRLYPSIKNVSMRVELIQNSTSTPVDSSSSIPTHHEAGAEPMGIDAQLQSSKALQFLYRVSDMTFQPLQKSYGIIIAQMAAFPSALIDDAKKLSLLMQKHSLMVPRTDSRLECDLLLHTILSKLMTLRYLPFNARQVIFFLVSLYQNYVNGIGSGKLFDQAKYRLLETPHE